jgi:hypothetical protein
VSKTPLNVRVLRWRHERALLRLAEANANYNRALLDLMRVADERREIFFGDDDDHR